MFSDGNGALGEEHSARAAAALGRGAVTHHSRLAHARPLLEALFHVLLQEGARVAVEHALIIKEERLVGRLNELDGLAQEKGHVDRLEQGIAVGLRLDLPRPSERAPVERRRVAPAERWRSLAIAAATTADALALCPRSPRLRTVAAQEPRGAGRARLRAAILIVVLAILLVAPRERRHEAVVLSVL